MDIVDKDLNKVGYVSSGTHSPTLKKSIGMGYVSPKLASVSSKSFLFINCFKVGTELFGVVRGKNLKITIEKMPFVPHKYFRGESS